MKILIAALFTCAFLAIGCDPAAITGSGNITSKDHSVETFNKLSVKGEIDVDVTYGTTPSVRIEADDNLHDRITVRVINNVLELNTNGQDVDFSKVTAHVVMPSISGVSTHGSGNINVGVGFCSATLDIHSYGSGSLAFRGIDAEKVTSRVIGSGKVSYVGNIDNHNCTIDGSGDLIATQCTSEQAAIAVFGSGDADVNVSSLLYADIFGSGNIAYKGSAEVRQKIVGSGKLIKRS